jgi:ParB family transcriptional regulator, chromosome partitioning protein
LRLLKLPDFARSLLASGQISAGHGRALLAVADPDATAKNILADGLTVRDVERLGREREPEDAPSSSGAPVKIPAEVDADTQALEHSLSVALGTNVSIRHRGESGEVRIKFKNFEQLDDFCRRLCSSDSAALRKSRPGT